VEEKEEQEVINLAHLKVITNEEKNENIKRAIEVR
jgi:hypothetical protein